MKKEVVVMNVISRKLTDLVEDLSTNEFVEQVGDEIFRELGEELSHDEIKVVTREKVLSLIVKITEFVKENK